MAFSDRIHRMVIADADPIQVHHEYVAFLTPNSVTASLILAWGTHALFDVTGSQVRAVSESQRKYDGYSVTQFLTTLRESTN